MESHHFCGSEQATITLMLIIIKNFYLYQNSFIYTLVINGGDAIMPIPLHSYHFRTCHPNFLLPAFAFLFLRTFSGCQSLFGQSVWQIGHAKVFHGPKPD